MIIILPPRPSSHVVKDSTKASADPTTEGSVRLERDFPGRIIKVWVVAPWPAVNEIIVKSTAQKHFADIPIPVGSAGRIIGKGGSRVKEISYRSGARIKVSDASVRVEADIAEAIHAAECEIRQVLRAHMSTSVQV